MGGGVGGGVGVGVGGGGGGQRSVSGRRDNVENKVRNR